MSRRSAILSLFAVIALSILGVILAQSIPNAVFPEFVFHRAIILADSAELPASQVLVAVTRPLEEAAYSVPGTTLVRSTTTRSVRMRWRAAAVSSTDAPSRLTRTTDATSGRWSPTV